MFIAPYCDGMVLYALFSGFVIAFPTSSRHKLWFVPVGVALIYGINVLRLVAMSINHHYTFAFIVYGFIGLLWLWWVTRLAGPVEVGSPNSALPPPCLGAGPAAFYSSAAGEYRARSCSSRPCLARRSTTRRCTSFWATFNRSSFS